MQPKQVSSPGVRYAMVRARRNMFFPMEDVATSLHITREELFQYENGTKDIPEDIMVTIITMGYTMLRARNMQHKDNRLMRFVRHEGLWAQAPK